jgi:hypothetical protein
MQIYIRRNKEEFGPYSKEAALEYVKRGVFKEDDHARYDGAADWKKVGQLLGIGAAAGASRLSNFQGAGPRSALMQTTGSLRQQPVTSRRGSKAVGEQKKTFMIGLNLVLILLVVAGIYIRMGGGGETGRRILAAVQGLISRPPSDATDTTGASAPPPVPEPAAPVIAPAPVDAAALALAPAKPFDPAELAGNPAAWPKTVRLKQATVFPAVFNAQVVGSVTVPPGAVVKLVNVQGDQLVLNYQGGTQTLSWKLTDLDEEVAKSGSLAPAAGPAPAAETVATPAPAAGTGATSATAAGTGDLPTPYFGSPR